MTLVNAKLKASVGFLPKKKKFKRTLAKVATKLV